MESLRAALGDAYVVRFPKMPNEAEPDFATWKNVIAGELAEMGDGAILIGHSIGGSVVIRVLVDGGIGQSLAGAFVLSAPFWHDDDFWNWKEAQLPADAAERIPHDLPLFLYHGREDEVVPVSHVEMYARVLPQATVRRLDGRNHMLNDDLSEVAQAIKRLS
ncbi:hypothetical protein FHS01_001231 [Longimicrobium terrae]|nr:hypothetical protein [Longimicrobium terrae]